MGSILVTGAAGFIGTNFVRYWVEQHPGDHVVALDVAHVRGRARERRRHRRCHVRAGRHRRHRGGRAGARGTHGRSHRQLRGRVAQQPGDHRSRTVLPHQRAGHPGALCEAARRVGVARFHHVSTCEVYGDLVARHRREVRRGVRRTGRARRTTRPRPAATTSCAPTTRRGTCRSRSRTAPTTTGRSSSPRR